jgi:hypothetical protein
MTCVNSWAINRLPVIVLGEYWLELNMILLPIVNALASIDFATSVDLESVWIRMQLKSALKRGSK